MNNVCVNFNNANNYVNSIATDCQHDVPRP